MANLHLVSPSPASGRGKSRDAAKGEGVDLSPELELRALFHAERQAEDVARLARQAILDARRAYAAKHGLTSLPSIDRLREIFA